ncbi:hypothetical protein A2U01_0071058, partial [Trifolium medium]|nr:hypothetical protein [Trifolium medium]
KVKEREKEACSALLFLHF